MAQCEWWRLRCKRRAKKAAEAAAEEERWNSLDQIPDNLDEQATLKLVVLSGVGLITLYLVTR